MGYKLTGMYIGTQKVRPPLQLYWNISGAVEAGTCNLNQSNYYDECLEFSKDGLHFYTSSNATGNGPYQVDLGTPWDVTTATLTETFSQSNATGIYFHGDKMYLKYRSSAVKQFTVTVMS